MHTESAAIGLLQNRRDVARSVQYADDFQRPLVGAVGDQVGVDRPEFHIVFGQILSSVTDAWILTQLTACIQQGESHTGRG